MFYSGLISGRRAHTDFEVSDRFKKGGFIGAFAFGIALSFLEMPACPCCASVLFAIAGFIGLSNSWAYSIAIFLSFAVGQSFPVLLIGSSSSLIKFLTSGAERMEERLQFAAGIILIGIALTFYIIA